jgi:hypothetical protein
VDGVDAAIIPVPLGGGIPVLLSPRGRTRLTLRNRPVYEKSRIVGLGYDVVAFETKGALCEVSRHSQL